MLALALVALPAAQARPPDPIGHPGAQQAHVCCRMATEFLRGAPADSRRALCTDAGSRPGLCGLGQVLQRGSQSRDLLMRVVANPHARPYLVNTLKALAHVDRVNGVDEVLRRMASGRDDASVRGAAFEVCAGACLGPRIRGIGVMINGNEVDGLLDDGTVIEMKDRRKGYIGKAESQLRLRCRPGGSSMLMVSHEPDPTQLEAFRRFASQMGGRFTVMVADPVTLTAHTVFSSEPPARRLDARPVARPLR